MEYRPLNPLVGLLFGAWIILALVAPVIAIVVVVGVAASRLLP